MVPYVFTPGNAGAGTIKTNIQNFDIRLLVAIININRETIIYSPGISGRGYTSLSNDTITLEFDTSSYSDSDILQIVYGSTDDYPVKVSSERNNDLLSQLQRLVKITESLQVVDSAQRQRVTIDAGTLPAVTTVGTVTTVTTVSTVSTVSSVTNVASNAGMDREQYINIAKQTYAQSIRSRLTIQ